jgi:hypothetical protein
MSPVPISSADPAGVHRSRSSVLARAAAAGSARGPVCHDCSPECLYALLRMAPERCGEHDRDRSIRTCRDRSRFRWVLIMAGIRPRVFPVRSRCRRLWNPDQGVKSFDQSAFEKGPACLRNLAAVTTGVPRIVGFVTFLPTASFRGTAASRRMEHGRNK